LRFLFGNQLCCFVYPGQKVKTALARAAKSTYRLGVIGFAHMHVNELIAQFVALEQVKLIACADTIPSVPSLTEVDGSRRANLRRALESAGPPRAYENYLEMLDTEDLDIVIFCPEISRHAEVAEALAVRGIHMVTEKPMAGSLSDALRMVRAARNADVALMVNWPTTWSPWVLKVKDLIDAGEIGDVWEFKWRNGPSLGPLAAGSTHPGNTVISGAPSARIRRSLTQATRYRSEGPRRPGRRGRAVGRTGPGQAERRGAGGISEPPRPAVGRQS
jgi:hypothetical protein